MSVDIFLKKIYNLKHNESLSKSEVIQFISIMDKKDEEVLIDRIKNDIDAQIRIKSALEKALPSNNNKSDIKNKITDILCILKKLSEEVVETFEETKTTVIDASILSDHEARLIVLSKNIQENIEKINSLEVNQASMNDLRNDLKTSKNTLKAANKKLDDATKQSKDVLNQSIEVIGIFVAIITVFIGGFSEISLFGTIENLNTYKFFLYVVLTGHIMADLIFMFVYMLGRITNKTISVSCVGYLKIQIENDIVENKCQNCCYKSSETCKKYNINKEHCTLARKLRYKYPYIYYTNLVAIVTEVLLCLGWLFSQDILIIKSGFWAKTLIIVIVALLAGIFVKKTIHKIKKIL